MTKTVGIYFDDLKPEAQEHLLMTWDTSKDDENWDTVPLAVIEKVSQKSGAGDGQRSA